MILLKRDVTDPNEKPLLLAQRFVTNADGTTSIQMPDGSYAYQSPNEYGVFHMTNDPNGAYQHCEINGQLVSFWTRPTFVPPDAIYVYSWVKLPNS